MLKKSSFADFCRHEITCLKANVSMDHYANVSKLSMSSEDRKLNRQFNKLVRSPKAGDEMCSSLTIKELSTAIQKLKTKGAAGPDDIPPSFLKALGPIVLQELL